jgi:hypothetical protein
MTSRFPLARASRRGILLTLALVCCVPAALANGSGFATCAASVPGAGAEPARRHLKPGRKLATLVGNGRTYRVRRRDEGFHLDCLVRASTNGGRISVSASAVRAPG